MRRPSPTTVLTLAVIGCLVAASMALCGCIADTKEDFQGNLILAKNGDAAAQERVGVEYGRHKDFATARLWLEKAAAQGNAAAAYDLAYIESEGLDGPKDLQKAYAWAAKSARLGDPHGQFIKGYMQLDGSGDGLQDGLNMIDRAASQHYAEASFFLGDLYSGRSHVYEDQEQKKELKLTVPKDLAKARHYYQLASKDGHPKAPFTYAMMCEAGQGGRVDLVEAYVWYSVAEDLHDSQAYGRALNLAKRMRSEDVGVAYQRALGRRLGQLKKQLGLG